MQWFNPANAFVVLYLLLVFPLFLRDPQQRWRFAQLGLGLLALASLILLGLSLSTVDYLASNTVLRISALQAIVLSLIAFIAWVVLRYARDNLRGDGDEKRFLKWYLLTLVAVCLTVSSNHLLLFAAAWISISLSLHQLLLFYPDRPRAKLAAHKKFLFARLSEVFLIAAFALLYLQHETFYIAEILSYYQQNTVALSTSATIAAVLLAAVALIKCAQLPLHGWLIQVVEAPTPVSALLHAGIINLGGYLLLLFSPLFGLALVAQWLVLIVAGLSTVLAALVMMTRVSIKVKLAWSTVAQMGLMLIECALGLYELALLHLLAHSCYKALAFLSAGEAVNHYLRRNFSNVALPKARHWTSGAALAALLLTPVYVLNAKLDPLSPWLLLAIALVTMFAFHFSTRSDKTRLRAIGLGVIGLGLYAVLASFTGLITSENTSALSSDQSLWLVSPLADAWIAFLFLSLFGSFLWLMYMPQTAFARALFIALNAGFYLDEWATRITLKLWPISMPQAKTKSLKTQNFDTSALEARYE